MKRFDKNICVFWWDYEASFVLTGKPEDINNAGYGRLTIKSAGDIEVIGNIYENPELLTQPS